VSAYQRTGSDTTIYAHFAPQTYQVEIAGKAAAEKAAAEKAAAEKAASDAKVEAKAAAEAKAKTETEAKAAAEKAAAEAKVAILTSVRGHPHLCSKRGRPLCVVRSLGVVTIGVVLSV
jgi:membrane protein involved in colicin uptake